MKFAALSYSESYNIGDEIQTLAAKKFLPRVDFYVDRDHMSKECIDKKTKIILNGWFAHKPEYFLPPENMIPLFISFHITHRNKSLSLFRQTKYIAYLRKYEPIGCRDEWTLLFIRSLGLEAYLSRCLTFCLDNEYGYRTNKILLVDPFLNSSPVLRESYIDQLVPEEFKKDVEVVSHWFPKVRKTNQQKIILAKSLIEKYATAKLVLTSRLHCALPSFAMGTPTYFMDFGYRKKEQRNRFGSLLNNIKTIDKPAMFFYLDNNIRRVFQISKLDSMFIQEIKRKIDWEPDNDFYSSEEISFLKKTREELNDRVKNFLIT